MLDSLERSADIVIHIYIYIYIYFLVPLAYLHASEDVIKTVFV